MASGFPSWIIVVAVKSGAWQFSTRKMKASAEKAYRDLIAMTENTVGYAESALVALSGYHSAISIEQASFIEGAIKELAHYLILVRQVICQAKRRVIHGESVPASEKLVLIFEEHTDIIRKDRRETYYGHKICLAGGASNLILDCMILSGNPADSTLSQTMLDRQEKIYGRPPLKIALDGGFTSKNNLVTAKKTGCEGCLFFQRTRPCRTRYVSESLCLQGASEVPCRNRIRHILA